MSTLLIKQNVAMCVCVRHFAGIYVKHFHLYEGPTEAMLENCLFRVFIFNTFSQF